MIKKNNILMLLSCSCTLLAVLFSSFTQLRFENFGFGFAEIFGMFGIISYIFYGQTRYINIILFGLLIGFLFGFLLGSFNNMSMNVGSEIQWRDLFAVVYAIAISFVLSNLVKSKPIIFTYFLLVFDASVIAHVSVILLPTIGIEFPYWLGVSQGETFYAPISYDGRFVGLSQNPHQIGILLTTYIAFMFFKRGEGIKYASFHFLSLFCAFILFILIKSTTLIFAYSFIAVICFAKIYLRFNLRNKILTIILVTLITSILLSYILEYFTELLSNNGKSDASGRFALWDNAITAIYNGNLLGLGPGAHSGELKPYEGTEAHNVFLDILMQGGIISLLFYLIIYFIAFFKSIKYKYFAWTIALIALFVSQMSGYFLRNIFAWIPIFTALVWSSSHQNSLKLYFSKN
jgi:O-antigen ligase